MKSEKISRGQNLVLLSMAIGAVMNPLLASMITLALPNIGFDFAVSARDLGWMTTAFILANAICLVPAARFVDKFGYKKSYILGTLILSLSCMLSVFAPNYTILIILRVIAGCSVSLVMITALAILTRVFPQSRHGMVIGINTAMVYVGMSIGPVIGGVITEMFGWKSIFILMIPLLLLSAAMITIFLKQEFTEPVIKFDLIGTILYAAAIFSLMFGLSTITEFGSIFLVIAGIILIIIFSVYELKQKYPILHVELFFKNKRFSRSALAALLNYGAVYGSVYMLSIYLQSVGALTAIQTGFILLFQPLIQVIMTPIAGRLSDKIDPKYLVTLGMICTVTGLLLLSGLGLISGDVTGYIALTQVFIGLGAALFSAPNTYDLMDSVPPAESSTASGIVAVVRQIGMLMSMAICMSSISFFVGGTELIAPEMYSEFVLSFQAAMLISACIAAVGIFTSWFRGEANKINETK